MGAGLASSFLLNGGQQGQVKGPGEILKAVVKGDQTGDALGQILVQQLPGRLLDPEKNLVGFHGVGLVLCGVVRVDPGQACPQVGRHGPGVGRVHPVVGVPVAVVVAVVFVPVVVVGEVFQQVNSL